MIPHPTKPGSWYVSAPCMNVKLPPNAVLKEHIFKRKNTSKFPKQIMIPSPFDNKTSKGEENDESKESDLEILHTAHNPLAMLKRL